MPFSITPEGRLGYIIEIVVNLHEYSPKYPKTPKTFGELLRKKRMDNRLTMKDIARRLGVTETTVYNWEIRDKRPYRKTREKLKSILGLNEEDISI
ncbi:MAG: helix-turn-helix domain-containing protein [Candidatus Omnitrophica bacterium]|nr:helix-turn-helix domain-containing protein [Candidatus Omnitrophota bacterium]